MKILFVVSLYHQHVGGIETIITELSTFYKSQGHSVSVLTKKWPLSLCDFDTFNDIPIYRVLSAKTDDEFGFVAKRLLEIEDGIKADVVHLVGLRRPMGLFALAMARRWGVPLIASVGGGELPEQNDKKSESVWKQSKDIAIPVIKQADWNVTFSNDLVELIKENVDSNITADVIYAGIDLGFIDNTPKKEYSRDFIFSARRLDWSKAVDMTVDAFAAIANDYPDLDLLVAGVGDQEYSLKSLVKLYNLEGRVKFLGSLPLDEVIGWLKSAYVSVIPSRSEGGGLINLEAQACGCPIVGSRAAGISEYTKENSTSLLFDVGDLNTYIKHLKNILDNPDLQKKLSKNGREFTRGFSWDNIALKYINGYFTNREDAKNKKFINWSNQSKIVWSILKS